MKTEKWLLCPVCRSKTRLKLREDTVLENFPLYCPKCKKEVLPAFTYIWYNIRNSILPGSYNRGYYFILWLEHNVYFFLVLWIDGLFSC